MSYCQLLSTAVRPVRVAVSIGTLAESLPELNADFEGLLRTKGSTELVQNC